MGYNLVTQLFPLVVLALPQVPLASRTGALMGIIAGKATVAFFSLSGGTLVTWFPSWPKAITDINVGMIALLVNVMVVTVVSLGTRKAFVAHEYATARAPRTVSPGRDAASTYASVAE
jgi:solute:Na+ symporter, SSS family